MPLNTNLNSTRQELLLELIHESLNVHNHFELLLWLQGKLQTFLPHEIMIAAWGNFAVGQIYFDIVSSLPGLRTKGVSQIDVSPLLKRLFSFWDNQNKAPFILKIKQGEFNGDGFNYNFFNDQLNSMTSAVVHGIQDYRDCHDCIYILMSAEPMPAASSKMLESLLPVIDCALRKVEHLPEQLPYSQSAKALHEDAINALLSMREVEIMDWVIKGKTNIEIGTILGISVFTVKNHLYHIFKKLDVLNRVQAASKYKQEFNNR
jgi:transcriptional regulator EpsA